MFYYNRLKFNPVNFKLFYLIKINTMKKLLVITLLSSISFSAQVSSRKLLKIDTLKFPKIEKPFVKTPLLQITNLDSAIAKLYKMPVAKPKNPEIYSSLKAPKKNMTLYRMPNIFDAVKPPQLAAK